MPTRHYIRGSWILMRLAVSLDDGLGLSGDRCMRDTSTVRLWINYLFLNCSVQISPESQERSKIAIAWKKSIYSAKQLTIWHKNVTGLASVSGMCPVMSDSYSGNDAAMMSELKCCYVAARESIEVSSDSKAGLWVWTSMALAPECSLTFPQKCTC